MKTNLYIDHDWALLSAGSPLIGFGEVPLDPPVSVIDFHGLADGVIPYDAASGNGEGPFGSVVSWDYYYYEQKPDTIARWVELMGCGDQEKYTTGWYTLVKLADFYGYILRSLSL